MALVRLGHAVDTGQLGLQWQGLQHQPCRTAQTQNHVSEKQATGWTAEGKLYTAAAGLGLQVDTKIVRTCFLFFGSFCLVVT